MSATISLWMGRDIRELSRDELIKALETLGKLYQDALDSWARGQRMQSFFRAERRQLPAERRADRIADLPPHIREVADAYEFVWGLDKVRLHDRPSPPKVEE